MALHLVSRIGDSPVWRAGLASVFILGLAGIAGAVIPNACRTGVIACGVATGEPDPALAEAGTEPDAAGIAAAAPPQGADVPGGDVVEVAAVPQADPASIAGNDLVAATFSALEDELAVQPSELVARRVSTVEIGPDGQPVEDLPLAQVAPLVPAGDAAGTEVEPGPGPAVDDARSVEPVVPESPPVEVEQDSSETRVAEVSAEPSADVGAAAYAPVGQGSAVVTGRGANVRSVPAVRGSDVLFALAGGVEVTVVEMRQGWARVVDSRGRSGWMYGDYLRR